jgi:hypothetical protein
MSSTLLSYAVLHLKKDLINKITLKQLILREKHTIMLFASFSNGAMKMGEVTL